MALRPERPRACAAIALPLPRARPYVDGASAPCVRLDQRVETACMHQLVGLLCSVRLRPALRRRCDAASSAVVFGVWERRCCAQLPLGCAGEQAGALLAVFALGACLPGRGARSRHEDPHAALQERPVSRRVAASQGSSHARSPSWVMRSTRPTRCLRKRCGTCSNRAKQLHASTRAGWPGVPFSGRAVPGGSIRRSHGAGAAGAIRPRLRLLA